MSTRNLFLGIVLILAAGAAAWYVTSRTTSSPPLRAGTSLQESFGVDGDRAVVAVRPDTADIVERGDDAILFSLETLAGGTFDLADQRGRFVVLNFWATWCAPCREEMPDLVMLQDSLESQGLVVAGISLDEEGRAVVAPFHDTFPVDYPLLLDGLPVARLYGAHYVVPTTIVVDAAGRVTDRFEGAVTLEHILPLLRVQMQRVE